MEVFQDLCINVTAEQLADLICELEQNLPAGWSRDHAAEERLQTATVVTPKPTYCFSCTKKSNRAAALLVLIEKEPGCFHVSNIVPKEERKLTYAKYNAILGDFYLNVFKPFPALSRLPHQLTDPLADLEQWMTPETADLLRGFSSYANRSTGASLRRDQERWNAFLVAAHKEDSKLDPSTLGRWLIEMEKWPDDTAHELAMEYESARELLKYAAAHNGF